VKWVRPILLVVLLAAAAFGIWRFLFPPPEKVIRKNLAKLAAAVSENPQGNIAKVANANRIASCFHAEVTVNLQGFGREVEAINGRSELQQMAMAARQNVGQISLAFPNIHVEVEADRENARAIVSVVVTLNQGTPIAQDVKFGFTKVDRAWLIKSVEPLRVAL
jgi:hypothetical protein